MRPTLRAALAFSVLAVAFPAGVAVMAGPALAAPQDAAPADQGQPKEIPLTQTQIDGIVAAQPAMQAVEAKLPQGAEDKPDPQVESKLEAIAKKNGFSGLGEYTDVSSTIGNVMAGMDPETKTYVGPEAVIKKQMAEVNADKSMPPKEKKEALAELSAALQPAASAKPMPSNIALVSKNFDKLNQAMQQQGGAD